MRVVLDSAWRLALSRERSGARGVFGPGSRPGFAAWGKLRPGVVGGLLRSHLTLPPGILRREGCIKAAIPKRFGLRGYPGGSGEAPSGMSK